MKDQQIKYSSASPLDSYSCTLRNWRPVARNTCSANRLAAAATLIAAESIQTADYDLPDAFANPGALVVRAPDRGKGFREDLAPPLAPWFTDAGFKIGAVFGQGLKMTCRSGWFPGESDSDAELGRGVPGAANFAIGLHVAPRRASVIEFQSWGHSLCSA